MEVLASSRLLADTDVFGGGASKASFVVERDGGGQPLAMRVVKVRARVHVVAIVAAVCPGAGICIKFSL